MSKGMHQPDGPPDIITVQQNVTSSHDAGIAASTDDLRMVEALRSGNEAAFVSLVDRYHAAMLRLAIMFVTSQAVAEEVVQEAWIGVLQGLNRFEGRSSLKTWIFRILTNCAKTRARRERFRGPDQEWPGHWISFPHNWNEIPEERILSQETRACIQVAINALPPGQREVITLRDIEGWSSDETCNLLGVSEANQRVLLHRARSRVRRALEKYFEEE